MEKPDHEDVEGNDQAEQFAPAERLAGGSNCNDHDDGRDHQAGM